MITTTVKDLWQRTVDDNSYRLYLCRNHEMVLYIGIAEYPTERMHQHLSSQLSPLGPLIKAHLPASLDWIVELYTVAECSALVEQHRPEDYDLFQRALVGESPQRWKSIYTDSRTIAEKALIAHYHPVLNTQHNAERSPLPERYINAVQAAKALGRNEKTIRRWIAQGKIAATHTKKNELAIAASEVERLTDEQQAIPTEISTEDFGLLARVELLGNQMSALTERVDNLEAMLAAGRPARVHVHTEQGEYTARPAPGPAQGDLPEGLTPWRDYAREKGYSETTVKRHIDAGEIPVITGRWKRGHAVILAAIDDEGKAAMDRLFSGG